MAGNNDVGQREQLVIGGQRFRISDVAGGQREPASAVPYPYCLIAFGKNCCESSRDAPTATAGRADLAPIARGAGFANVITVKTLVEFKEGFLRALNGNDLYFIVAKVEAGAGDVPAAAFDTQGNKYLFMR